MRRTATTLARRHFGFAGLAHLKTPSDWDAAATKATAAALTHAAALRNGKDRDPLRTLRLLDAASVALCGVLDPAALCVAAHDCEDWRTAALRAADRVEGVMEELNANAALATAAAECASAKNLPTSARRLADAFHKEFSRDGAPGVAAARLAERQAVRHVFETNFDASASWTRVPCFDATLVARAVEAAAPGCAHASGNHVDLFTMGAAVSTFLTVSDDAYARKIVFDHHEAALSLEALDALASARRNVATAQTALEGSLIGGVEAAKAFVDGALRDAQRRAAFERRKGAALLGLDRLEPSDLLAAAHRLRGHAPVTAAGDVVATVCVAPPGFTVDEVPCAADEAWAPGVRKLVITGRATRATIYLDLGPRPGKPRGCAHYTVTCACDINGGDSFPAETWGLDSPSRLPAVGAIISSSYDERALAHEWGHALHGALHRSTSQHLAGTRGSTDAAELPSTALERLAPGDWRRRNAARGLESVAALRGAVFDLALHGAYGDGCDVAAALALADARAGAGRRADIIDWLPHVAEAPAALYAYPFGRARADALWRRPDAEDELLRVLEGDEGRALYW